jgi:putative PIN family toxin of toxin-antitoxin system
VNSVTLDSNVFVSALNFGGPCLRILTMARDGLIRLDLSNAIPEEVGGVLREKFHWPEDDIELAQREIASLSNYVSPQETLLAVPDDDDDNRVIECASAGRSDYLVTADKHLLRLGHFRSTRIIKPREFLEVSRSR